MLLAAVVLAALGIGLAVIEGSSGAHRHPQPRAGTLARRPRSPAAATAASATRAGVSAPAAELGRLISLGRPIYCAGRRGSEVALTFDDGPGP